MSRILVTPVLSAPVADRNSSSNLTSNCHMLTVCTSALPTRVPAAAAAQVVEGLERTTGRRRVSRTARITLVGDVVARLCERVHGVEVRALLRGQTVDCHAGGRIGHPVQLLAQLNDA